jgi:UDP-glucose:(heptosyl)LPS alpha-1,3-glucosyltransferase
LKLAFIKKRFLLYGGAERYLDILLQYLKQSGHEIHIFTNRWTQSEDIIIHKVDVFPIGSFLSTITFNQNVKRAIQNADGLDCIISFERTICQDIYRAGEGCHVEWLKLRKLVEPGWKRVTYRVNPLHTALLSLEKKLFSLTKLIIANSQMVKQQIVMNYGLSEQKICVIYNGVDLQRFSPQNRNKWRPEVRRDLSISENGKVILIVGSGFERKGLLTLFKALTKLKSDSPSEDIHLLVIGKGNIDKFKSIANKFGVQKNVIFLGTQKAVEKFYAAADVFVLPTIYDPFSNATLEAMASGLPTITTVNNGASEIIEEGTEGFILHDLFDYNGLALRIENALSSSVKMGENARHKAESYSIKKVAEEFMRVIQLFKNVS